MQSIRVDNILQKMVYSNFSFFDRMFEALQDSACSYNKIGKFRIRKIICKVYQMN